MEQCGRAIDEESGKDDIPQKMGALRDVAEPDERAEADGGRNRAAPGATGRKQQSEADEREAERGVTRDERAVSVTFRRRQRCRREAVWSAKCLDLDGPRASPMIL